MYKLSIGEFIYRILLLKSSKRGITIRNNASFVTNCAIIFDELIINN